VPKFIAALILVPPLVLVGVFHESPHTLSRDFVAMLWRYGVSTGLAGLAGLAFRPRRLPADKATLQPARSGEPPCPDVMAT